MLTQDLRESWKKFIRDGQIKNEFPEVGIEMGLRLVDGELEYYAINTKTKEELPGKVEERKIEGTDFVIQYNQFRACKPGSEKKPDLGKQPDVPSGEKRCRFGCNNIKRHLSLLVRDPSVQIVLPNMRWNAYYNATPFEKEGHYFWIPVERDGILERIPHYAQKLTEEIVEDTIALRKARKNAVLFFNSLHAGGSVDHIHIQDVFNESRLPIQDAKEEYIEEQTILDNYLIKGFLFITQMIKAETIWPYISRLQQANIPFNWILTDEHMYLVPRKEEHEIVSEFPNILGSMEISGKIITTDRKTYDETDALRLKSAFGKLSYSLEEILKFSKGLSWLFKQPPASFSHEL